MKEEYSELFAAFVQFRKLHISSIIPELSHSEFVTMKHIACANKKCLTGEKVKVSMISKAQRVNITAVSRTLKGLEEKGYIRRFVSEKDRRITYVELTGEGTVVLEEAEKKMDGFTEAILSRLGEEDILQLTAFMNRIYEAAEQEIDKRKCKKKGDVTE